MTNKLKKAIEQGIPQIGFWLSIGDSTTAEICACAGFDWVLIDGEHTPQTPHSIVSQLRAIGCHPDTNAIARVPSADPIAIKQYLDLGVQSILVPMVESAEQAKTVVSACRYPPSGTRGLGGARAALWGGRRDYLKVADDEIAVIVQVETSLALDNIEAIAAVDGIDGVFIGPADLSASLGYLGNPAHEVVQRAVTDAIARIRATGKAPGILTRDETLARRYLELGVLIVGVGMDAQMLAAQTRALAASFKKNN